MKRGDTQAHAGGRGPVKLREAGSGIGQLTLFTQKLQSSGAGGKTPLALQFHLKTQGKRCAQPSSTREHCHLSAG